MNTPSVEHKSVDLGTGDVVAKKINKTWIKRFVVRKILGRSLPLSLVPPDYVLPVDVKVLEDVADANGRIPCNLNFDDLCPRYHDKPGHDFGGNIRGGLAVEFRRVLQAYPHVGVTFFMIPNSLMAPRSLLRFGQDKISYDISSERHVEWLEYYKSLSATYNIEFALHGYYHRQFNNLLFARNIEFAFMSEEESLERIASGLESFRRVGLDARGFRQPGWDINSDLSLCRALKMSGFSYIAGSSQDAGFNAGRQRVSNDHPTLVDGLLNFPQNVWLDWSVDAIKKEIDRIVETRGIVSIKGHFVDRGPQNCLSSDNLRKLCITLDHLSKEHADSIEYVTLAQLAQRLQNHGSWHAEDANGTPGSQS